jgi:hypothetical protein
MLIQYADDTTIFVKSHKSVAQFVSKVERVTGEILRRFDANKLQVNFRKSSFIVFGRNRSVVSGITVDTHRIEACNKVKLLGLRIDNNLLYASHINYVISRMKQIRAMLFRLRHLFDRYTCVCI